VVVDRSFRLCVQSPLVVWDDWSAPLGDLPPDVELGVLLRAGPPQHRVVTQHLPKDSQSYVDPQMCLGWLPGVSDDAQVVVVRSELGLLVVGPKGVICSIAPRHHARLRAFHFVPHSKRVYVLSDTSLRVFVAAYQLPNKEFLGIQNLGDQNLGVWPNAFRVSIDVDRTETYLTVHTKGRLSVFALQLAGVREAPRRCDALWSFDGARATVVDFDHRLLFVSGGHARKSDHYRAVVGGVNVLGCAVAGPRAFVMRRADMYFHHLVIDVYKCAKSMVLLATIPLGRVERSNFDLRYRFRVVGARTLLVVTDGEDAATVVRLSHDLKTVESRWVLERRTIHAALTDYPLTVANSFWYMYTVTGDDRVIVGLRKHVLWFPLKHLTKGTVCV
jgi:hypothetical protein